MGFFRKRFGPFISMILTAALIRVDYVAIFGMVTAWEMTD